MRDRVFTAFLALAMSSTAQAQHHHSEAASTTTMRVGTVKLRNEGNAAAQEPFQRGLALLHNFEYSTAAEAFRQAQAADPGFGLAYWGEAMTYNHPLWAEQDAAAARAVLAKLGATPADRSTKARSPREAQWLAAVEALYGEGTKIERDLAYADRMAALFTADPADVDARAFYALSIMGTAHSGRDIGIYMRSAAVLEEGFSASPDHPGVVHYLIHAYDDPAHAPLGERAAARYANIAPDAGHAQHMVSHIYLALGRWPEVEKANIQAMKVVDAQRAEKGQSPMPCGHYAEWLVYAVQQQGRDSAVLVDACRAAALQEAAKASDNSVLGADRNLFNNWAAMAARLGVDRGQWPAATLPAGDRALYGRFMLNQARLLQAREDPKAAAAALAALRADRAIIAKAMPTERPDDHESERWFDLAILQGEAVVSLAAGDRDGGMKLLRKAAEVESSLPVPFGPPVLPKPSWELLGDELLAAGQQQEAAAAYRQALAAAPGRRLSVEGLAAATR